MMQYCKSHLGYEIYFIRKGAFYIFELGCIHRTKTLKGMKHIATRLYWKERRSL